MFRDSAVQLHNLYGPTEAAVQVTCGPCSRGGDGGERIVPIGRSLPNTQIYLVDRHGAPVPVGVPGELLIGGVQVGRGYLNRPELTNEKFIPRSFQHDGRERVFTGPATSRAGCPTAGSSAWAGWIIR